MSTVFHVHGFTDERGVRGVTVAQHDDMTVIEVARGVIWTAKSDHTEIVNFHRTWPLDSYGHEPSVTSVDAVTRTTLDGGETWREMWHYFGTASSPWPTEPRTPDKETHA